MPNEKPAPIKFRYEDVPELKETFADGVGQWHFDGSTLRVEFLVTRMDEAKSAQERSARKLPVCRLVLTAAGTMELLNECRRITAALERAGLVKKTAAEKAAAPAVN